MLRRGTQGLSDKISVANLSPLRQLPEDAGQPDAAPTGAWRGEAVSMEAPDAATLLDNAKEELTFAHSERMEKKKLEARSVEQPDFTRVDQVAEIQVYLDQLPDFDRGEFDRLMSELREGSGDRDEVLRQVGQRFGDPTHADAAMDLAQRALEREGRTELAGAVGAARALHAAEHGPAIRAGLNVSAAAFEAASGDRAAAQALRDGYRETVFSAAGPAGVYRGMVARMGTEGPDGGFQEQLHFLTRALGDDLASGGPSIEPHLLQQLITDLSALRMLDTVHDRCGELADRVRRQSGVRLDVPAVMKALLPLTEEAVSGPSRILALVGQLGLPAARLDTQVLFLREAREVVAMMPPHVFRDSEARFAALRGMQEAMDITIEREDAQ